MHDRLPALPQPLVSTKALRLCALRAPQAHYDADDVAMVDGIVRADDVNAGPVLLIKDIKCGTCNCTHTSLSVVLTCRNHWSGAC